MMNTKGFIWYLFQKEVLFFTIGFFIGLGVMIGWALGIVPIPYAICPVAP